MASSAREGRVSIDIGLPLDTATAVPTASRRVSFEIGTNVEPHSPHDTGGVSSHELREGVSGVARLVAAQAAIGEECSLRAAVPFVVLFRLVELIAQCGLFGLLFWWVPLKYVIPAGLLFWYLPAVLRCGLYSYYFETETISERAPGMQMSRWYPWRVPIEYPMFLFVVDDFSWFRVHPLQRPAWGIFTVMVSRVAGAVALLHFCNPRRSEDDSLCREIFVDDFVTFRSMSVENLLGLRWRTLVREFGHPDNFARVLLLAMAEVIMLLSIVYVVVACLNIFSFWIKRRCFVSRRNEELIDRIDCIAKAVHDVAVEEDDDECRQQLEALRREEKAQGGSPSLGIGCLICGWWPIPLMVVGQLEFRLILVFFNAVAAARTLTNEGFFTGLVLIGLFLNAWYMKAMLGLLNPFALWKDIERSTKRGIMSQHLHELLRTEKGVLLLLSIFCMVVNLPRIINNLGDPPFLIPSDWVNLYKALVPLGQVLTVFILFAVAGLFAYQDLDLGVEREGAGYLPRLARERLHRVNSGS